jgi:hypothetical protein
MATTAALTARETRVTQEPWKVVLYHGLQAAAGALDRLLPSRPLNPEVEPPPEWFKYPPI